MQRIPLKFEHTFTNFAFQADILRLPLTTANEEELERTIFFLNFERHLEIIAANAGRSYKWQYL